MEKDALVLNHLTLSECLNVGPHLINPFHFLKLHNIEQWGQSQVFCSFFVTVVPISQTIFSIYPETIYKKPNHITSQ